MQSDGQAGGGQLGFPQSSNELDQWIAQGRTFSGGVWHEAQSDIGKKFEEQTGMTPDELKLKEIETGVAEVAKGIAETRKQIRASQPTSVGAEITPGSSVAEIGGGVPSQGIVDPGFDTNGLDATKASDKIHSITNGISVDQEPSEDLTAVESFGADMQNILEQINATALSQQDKTALVQEQFEKFGITGTFQELQNTQRMALSIRQEIDQKKVSRQNELDVVSQKAVVQGIQNVEKNAINDRYNREIAGLSADLSATSALGSMLAGNLSMAQGFINQFVSASVYDQEREWKNMTYLFSTYQDLYQDLKKEEQDLWDKEEARTEFNLKEAKKDSAKKGKYLVDYPGAFIGMSIADMSVEQVEQQVADYKLLKGIGDGKGDGQFGLSKADEVRFWSEVDSAKNELQQGENWGSVWNRIKLQFPGVEDSTIDNALGGGTKMVNYDGKSKLEHWGWAKPGAYEEFKRSGTSGGGRATEEDIFNSL